MEVGVINYNQSTKLSMLGSRTNTIIIIIAVIYTYIMGGGGDFPAQLLCVLIFSLLIY